MPLAATAAIRGADLLDEAGATALLTRIRTHLEVLDVLLLDAWRGRIWIAHGHPTWDAWVRAELGDVRLRLPIEQRRAVALLWRQEGMSQRAIATGLGVSSGTVASDLDTAPIGGHPAVVISLDGRRRRASAPTPAPEPAPAPVLRKTDQVVLDLDGAGPAGLTNPEIAARHPDWSAPWSVTSDLHGRRGSRRIQRLSVEEPTGTRAGHAVYVHPNYRAERAVEPPGRRPRR